MGWSRSGSIQSQFLGVEQNRHGAIVDQGNPHIRLENTLTYPEPVTLHRSAELLIERSSQFRGRCIGEAGAVSLLAVGVERELADHQDLALGIQKAEIHFALRVGEDPKLGDFLGHSMRDRRSIRRADSQQHQDSGTDLAYNGPIDNHMACLNSL